MSKEENEDRVLNLVKDSLPFKEYLQVFAWLNSHRKVEDLESKIDGLYKFGVSEIRTTIDLDNRYNIAAQVANALTNEIKKPLLEEIEKQKELLNIFDETLRILGIDFEKEMEEPFDVIRIIANHPRGLQVITKKQKEAFKEWKERREVKNND